MALLINKAMANTSKDLTFQAKEDKGEEREALKVVTQCTKALLLA